MKIQIRIEVFFIESFDRRGVFGGNMQIAHVLAHHGAVLGFGQSIVVGAPRPRFGLLDEQLI